MIGILSFLMVVCAIMICHPRKARACILFYAGGDTTDDGANMFMRTEEMNEDTNKIYYVSPAGNHVKGEVYQGCSDFTWTFTHDSCRYTARRDDNLFGICPDCGRTHFHTPFEEDGTNEHGVTISATQTIYANSSIEKTDPFTKNGIGEAEIATVLLSEARTAREGLELLLSIYDSVGAGSVSNNDPEGAGTMICDQKEQWYVECLSGHEYIAVLLPPNVAFMQFNVSVLGRIDLKDKKHVIASDHVIDVAQKAGTFVGDAEHQIIDFRASYNDYLVKEHDADRRLLLQERMAAALNFLSGTDTWTTGSVLEDNDFVMTNIDEHGHIVPLHNALVLKDKMSLDHALALFRLDPIGYVENVNTHLLRFYRTREQPFGTVEWSTMDNTRYNVFVPCFPMLLTDTWEGCKVSLDKEQVVEQPPKSKDCYFKDGKYHVYPKGWENSYIATLSALSSVLTYGSLSEKGISLAEYNLCRLQKEFVVRFSHLSDELQSTASTEDRERIMTRANMEMTAQVHDLAMALYRYYVYGEKSGQSVIFE